MTVALLDDLNRTNPTSDGPPFSQSRMQTSTWRGGCCLAPTRAKGSSMPKQQIITYSSPAPAKTLAKVFGDKASEVRVSVRASKDVPKFLARLAEARRKARQSTLRFK